MSAYLVVGSLFKKIWYGLIARVYCVILFEALNNILKTAWRFGVVLLLILVINHRRAGSLALFNLYTCKLFQL